MNSEVATATTLLVGLLAVILVVVAIDLTGGDDE